jgi:predicted N-acyltransferase
MKFDVTSAPSVSSVPAAAWDALVGDDNPFVEHAFLALLEESGSVGRGTAWLARPVLVHADGRLVGAAPAYVRADSYGEYIFDWAWAQAATRAGLDYYPKLSVAVPFTPATGPRLLVHPDAPRDAVVDALLDGLEALAAAVGASGSHVLFHEARESEALEARGFVRRATHQYHWRNDGYASFDDFLGALRASARKQIRRERREVAESGLEIAVRTGDALTRDDWKALERFYFSTAQEKWGRPYLTPRFFALAPERVGRRALGVVARRDGVPIAGTLSFEKGAHVYGRYWGAVEHVPMLHFELCYYQLVEHAIRTGKRLVEAGAQGEHKLKRGFVPVAIHSAHRLVHPGLHDAVRRFVEQERDALGEALPEWAEHAPFRADARPDFPAIAGVEVGRTADEEPPAA